MNFSPGLYLVEPFALFFTPPPPPPPPTIKIIKSKAFKAGQLEFQNICLEIISVFIFVFLLFIDWKSKDSLFLFFSFANDDISVCTELIQRKAFFLYLQKKPASV